MPLSCRKRCLKFAKSDKSDILWTTGQQLNVARAFLYLENHHS